MITFDKAFFIVLGTELSTFIFVLLFFYLLATYERLLVFVAVAGLLFFIATCTDITAEQELRHTTAAKGE